MRPDPHLLPFERLTAAAKGPRSLRGRVLVQFGPLYDFVILSGAVFQAQRRISRLTGLSRKPNCTLPGGATLPALSAHDGSMEDSVAVIPETCVPVVLWEMSALK
jgi:hypothetical protein